MKMALTSTENKRFRAQDRPGPIFMLGGAPTAHDVLSERGYLRFGGARRIPIGGMKFAESCTEFSEATVVEASVFGLGILARLPERPST
jgi:hypothetical protein